jgi:hypothetical protein
MIHVKNRLCVPGQTCEIALDPQYHVRQIFFHRGAEMAAGGGVPVHERANIIRSDAFRDNRSACHHFEQALAFWDVEQFRALGRLYYAAFIFVVRAD